MAALSIVIPTDPNEADLKPFLTHLLRAVAPLNGAEIIVIDASADAHVSPVCRSMGVSVHRSLGLCATQMNLGAARAHGDYLMFLHPDTRLPASFADAWRAMRRQGTTWGFFSLRFPATGWPLRWLARVISWRSRLSGVASGEQGIFVHRNAWLLVGGFRDLALMEDVDLCKRLRQLAAPYVLRPAVESCSGRWRQQGLFRTLALDLCLRAGFWMGMDSRRLVRLQMLEQGKVTKRRTPELP